MVRAAAELSGHTVVLENLVHQAMLHESAGRSLADVLTAWEQRSRATPTAEQTDVRGPESWLVTPVEYRGERWGRLVMLPDPTDAPAFDPEHVMVLERAAMALTVARLTRSSSWERDAHRTTLLDIVEQRYRSAGEAQARVEALGVPARGGRFLITLVTLPAQIDDQTELEEGVARQLREVGVPALVGRVSPTRVAALLTLGPSRPWRAVVERVSAHVRAQHPAAVVTVGCEISDLTKAARSFQEATQVARAAMPGERSFYERSDIGLRELLYALRDDLGVQDYVERHIGRLVEHDHRHSVDLVATLRTYLDVAGNKTAAARRRSISRQALYERLRTIERLLECDLESGRQRTQLHVALTALDALRPRGDL